MQKSVDRQEVCLTVSGLTKSYRGQGTLWQDISFELHAGEILGIRGANGTGKSTLLRILATLERPDSGTVEFCQSTSVTGQDIFRGAGRRQYREVLGYVPQELALYPELTGYDNLRFWGRANHATGKLLEERIRQVCSDVGLPEGTLRKKVAICSGGQKRRLNLAAALLHEPRILLLDEPVAGIDEESRQAILQVLEQRRAEGAAVVYVGHERQELEQVSTRCVRLEEGKWLEYGTDR